MTQEVPGSANDGAGTIVGRSAAKEVWQVACERGGNEITMTPLGTQIVAQAERVLEHADGRRPLTPQPRRA